MNRNELADALYTEYSKAVGGKAYNGDDLPKWDDFSKDKGKQPQSQAWLAVADKALALAKAGPAGQQGPQPTAGQPVPVEDADFVGDKEPVKPKAPWGNAKPDPHFRDPEPKEEDKPEEGDKPEDQQIQDEYPDAKDPAQPDQSGEQKPADQQKPDGDA